MYCNKLSFWVIIFIYTLWLECIELISLHFILKASHNHIRYQSIISWYQSHCVRRKTKSWRLDGMISESQQQHRHETDDRPTPCLTKHVQWPRSIGLESGLIQVWFGFDSGLIRVGVGLVVWPRCERTQNTNRLMITKNTLHLNYFIINDCKILLDEKNTTENYW